jgi:DNA mismatch repair protein PMS2
MENALDSGADSVEFRFYRKGLNGFDVIYNGMGISDTELPLICGCMELRERNEIYKTKSIGYRGEALNSLAKSSTLIVITKHAKSEFAWRVEYNAAGKIANIT